MQATRIYLLRHGEVEGHERPRYNGQADVALTPRGEAQYGLLQTRLANKPLAAVYTSDLQRCRFGAELIGAEHDLEPVVLPALRELDIGLWQGMTWEAIREAYPDQWQARLDNLAHYQVPGGESLQQLADRVMPALAEVIARHPGREVAVIGHGGVNRVILLHVIGAPLERLFSLEQDFGCLNVIDYFTADRALVRLLNG